MKRIKIIFETEEKGVAKKFGYQINPDEKEYLTCSFDKDYAPVDISESKGIGDVTSFGKKMWRLIRAGLET